MTTPGRAYAEALVRPAPRGAWIALRRPALVALVIGASTGFSATGHLTLALLVSGFVCWSFVPLVQMATATVIFRGAPRAPAIPFSRRLDLWFMGHLPLSLWIALAGLVIGSAPISAMPEQAVLATVVVPVVWTNIIAAAYCRVVLGDSRQAAIARVAVHQTITWLAALLYFGWAVALSSRLAAFME